MSCKADAKYNFGRASEHDEIVYAGEEAIRRLIIVAAGHQLVCRAPARTCGDTAVAARPGAASQRCFNPDDKVTVPEVEEWAAFMSGHGIARVISLLSESEVGTYVQPPTDTLATLFKRAVLVDAKAPGAVDTLVSELKGAVDTGEKVVVHCWGGGGRTGVALAAWLVRHHGLTPAAAAEQVESYAKAQGASRRADVSQLQGFLGASA